MFRKYACTLLMVVASVIPAGAADAVATTGMPAVVAASTNPPLATDVDWSLRRHGWEIRVAPSAGPLCGSRRAQRV